MDIRFLGHACFELTEGSTRLLIDPFLSQNPQAAAQPSDLEPTHIVLTHGHFDHFGDIVEIASRTQAQCIAISEIAWELKESGIENAVDLNLGGTVAIGDGFVRLVPAWHTSTTPQGTATTAAGVVVRLANTTVYHLGDTALFSDLRLVARRDEPDVALMCIGGHYTMDRHDAVIAAELVGAPTVVPCHYNTFPPVETDSEAFKSEVETRTESRVELLAPGHSLAA